MRPALPPDLPNHFTEKGAQKLAERIERYWAERGYACKTHLVEHITHEAEREHGERHTIYFIRSNIGPLGFPPEKEASLD
jgi:hypothetical protein